ncbi:MAG TPA: hypothetical protein PLU22_01190 [Polyangiaceae bacterium]|nr:hypothetical protein [Polyangiaceae bacterium]
MTRGRLQDFSHGGTRPRASGSAEVERLWQLSCGGGCAAPAGALVTGTVEDATTSAPGVAALPGGPGSCVLEDRAR